MKYQNVAIYKYANRISIAILAVVLLSGLCSASEVAFIEVKYQNAIDLLPLVESMLSPQGKVTVSARVNSLVVVDDAAAIQRVRAYIDRFDRPVEPVRVRVRFQEGLLEKERAASARARVSGKDGHVSTGGKKKDGIDVRVDSRVRDRQVYSEYFVTTTSGQPAYISTGKEIPYREGRPGNRQRYDNDGETVRFKSVDSGFDVVPTIVGDHANIKIIPRMSYDDTEAGVIRFYGAQTEISAPVGEWVEIGGTSGSSNEVVREILSTGSGRSDRSVSMWLKVERQ